MANKALPSKEVIDRHIEALRKSMAEPRLIQMALEVRDKLYAEEKSD